MNDLMPVLRPRLPSSAEILPYLQLIDERRWYSNGGPLVTQLELQLSRHFGLESGGAVTTANGTAGLTAALLALRVPAGSFCLMPSWTFCATPHAARAAGMIPWFHDVASRTWALDPDEVLRTLPGIGGRVGAVVVVSPFGAPLDMPAWESFEERTGIPVVVDAAAGFDSVRPSRIPSVVSLHATKILGAGEGGFAATTDSSLRERLQACCNFGFQGTRSAALPALNAKMSEYHAAVALAGLASWPELRRRHTRIAEWYRLHIGRLEEVSLQPDYGTGWAAGTTSVILPPGSAPRMARSLLRQGIETRAWWGEGCHVQPAFADCARGDLSVTEDLGGRVLGLPHFADMEERDVERVAQAVSETLGCRRRPIAVAGGRGRGIDLYLGGSLAAWALEFVNPSEVSTVITTAEELAAAARQRGFRTLVSERVCTPAEPAGTAVSIHYPRVFPPEMIGRYQRMYNLHPGYLPWGRGCYPVFWALWEGTPAGATLHRITAGLQEGPIVDQIRVLGAATDAGGGLHERVREAERDLLRRYWPRIAAGEKPNCTAQPAGGSYHTRREFSEIKAHPPGGAPGGTDLIRLAQALELAGYSGLPAVADAAATPVPAAR
jgi:dTDP-4-amino-4,6-dideoxygalactose transaminase/folate-dependent phosphoribosylglycinamide formyltransferase PurN